MFRSRLEKARIWAHSSFAQWRQELSPGELEAIENYQAQLHHQINGHLRGVPAYAEETPWLQQQITALDSALSKGGIDQEVSLYRGFVHRGLIRIWNQLEPGDEFPEPGYLSTSLDSATAEGFALMHEGQGIFAELIVPIGTPAGFLDLVSPQNENEILLARGRRLRIQTVTMKGGQRRLVLEVINP